MNSKSL
jgi:hypothetical protein